MSLADPKFDPYRNQVEIWFDLQKPKESILLACRRDAGALELWLQGKQEDGWPELRADEWTALVDAKWERLVQPVEDAVVGDEFSAFVEPSDRKSSWQLYCRHALAHWNEAETQSLRDSVLRVLRRTAVETEGPIKGLVVGHVQSGKTAHMAGLMAMAADHGFNFFVILTGIIDNLRLQTQNRLFSDLNSPGNVWWLSLEHLSRSSARGQKLQDLHFDVTFGQRYMTAVLKNAGRLQNLLAWFKDAKEKWPQMRILVIDDEADQASVNTALGKERATAVFREIRALVDLSHKRATPAVRAMNYVGYTATPAAVLLNDGSETSLYPSNFVATLPRSPSYFGPAQVFGCEDTGEPGLDIVRTLDDKALKDVKSVHDGDKSRIPESLQDALTWFVCCVAVERLRDHSKPVTMLIHTSMRQGHHANVDAALAFWIKNCRPEELMSRCELVYRLESEKFDRAALAIGFPLEPYGRMDSVVALPEWQQISGLVKEILSIAPSRIPLVTADDGTNAPPQPKYHRGLHICVDNSDNGLVKDSEMVRLVYPDPLESCGFCPAFVVIGGNTLSRGLTLEGLVTSYFLRSTKIADALLQMGRWFGYRRGYELLPRLWMTHETQQEFRYLAQSEHDFREQVRIYATGVTPGTKSVGLLTPEKAFGKGFKITARNKMHNACSYEFDFQGVIPQTTSFVDSPAEQAENLIVADRFLARLLESGQHTIRPAGGSSPNTVPDGTANAIVVESVPFAKVATFLEEMHFDPRHRNLFGDTSSFVKWFKDQHEAEFRDWNVVVGAKQGICKESGSDDDTLWPALGFFLPKVQRTRLRSFATPPGSPYGSFTIGVLRDPDHLVVDGVDGHDTGGAPPVPVVTESDALRADAIADLRQEVGLGNVPQLLIYRIDAQSKPETRSESAPESEPSIGPKKVRPVRTALWPDAAMGEGASDIIGVSIAIPGARRRGQAVTRVTVGNLPVPTLDLPDIGDPTEAAGDA